MNEQRKKAITSEAQKRLNLWLQNTSFEKMTIGGSLMRFEMALGLFGGYPFEKEKWMDKNDFNGFLTEQEFYSIDYNLIVNELFENAKDAKKKLTYNNYNYERDWENRKLLRWFKC